MNKQAYRLVYYRLRGMFVAVEETASGAGNGSQGETAGTAHAASASAGGRQVFRFVLHPVAFAVLALAHSQIVPGGANSPCVIQTPNGLPQANINRPSSAGVSMNTYHTDSSMSRRTAQS
ncbi:ESPR-type extended signal peptide-containing protein [Paraburkholderia sediminicola]